MEKPIYTTSFLGNRVSVYPDRLVFRKSWGILGTTTIPINQIASVNVALVGNVTIETTGGKKYAIPIIGPDKGKKLQQAILKIQQIR